MRHNYLKSLRTDLFDKVLQTIDAGGLDFALHVSKQSGVNLNETHVRNLLSERLRKVGEIAGKAEAHFPRFVLSST